jgi:hypothetical protein
LGNREGNLEIYNRKRLQQIIAMEIIIDTISVDSSLVWTLIFDLDNKKDERKYYLRPINRTEGLWVTDKKNSISLDGYVINDGYYTSFDVGNIRIKTSYDKEDGHLIFQNLSFKTEAVRTSGDTNGFSEEVPVIHSFEATGRQIAKLTLKPN